MPAKRPTRSSRACRRRATASRRSAKRPRRKEVSGDLTRRQVRGFGGPGVGLVVDEGLTLQVGRGAENGCQVKGRDLAGAEVAGELGRGVKATLGNRIG